MNEDRFEIGITGLSEDMEDFVYEQDNFYEDVEAGFWSSFYSTCVSMLQNGVDLSPKQMNIINREYKKVEKKRRKEWKELQEREEIEKNQKENKSIEEYFK